MKHLTIFAAKPLWEALCCLLTPAAPVPGLTHGLFMDRQSTPAMSAPHDEADRFTALHSSYTIHLNFFTAHIFSIKTPPRPAMSNLLKLNCSGLSHTLKVLQVLQTRLLSWIPYSCVFMLQNLRNPQVCFYIFCCMGEGRTSVSEIRGKVFHSSLVTSKVL